MPPSLHWALVMVIGWLTGGLFLLIWMFIQAGFVKKIDPASKAKAMLILTVLGVLGEVVLMIMLAVSLAADARGAAVGIGLLAALMYLGIIILSLVAIFGMRSSLVRYYNTVEPIQLRLSGVMTFFFNTLYFQYHLTRVVEWKQTGRLI